MKKYLSLLFAGVLICGGFLYGFKENLFYAKEAIYLNANDEKSYLELKRLKNALRGEGKHVVLSDKNSFKSGEINLYAAFDEKELPKVLDMEAINFLWIEELSDMWALEKLRDFDVIVVKQFPLFSHLKAVNVRTAYIPDIIEEIEPKKQDDNGKVMYWGDNDTGFSLALYLAGKNDFSVDIYGNGFEGLWPKEEIMGKREDIADFRDYKFVLVDQSDEDIRDEVVNKKIIQIIEGGGLPLVRYNFGVRKLFGDDVPMYANEDEFLQMFNRLLSSTEETNERKKQLFATTKKWNAQSAALKFIELFEIMEKKRL